MIAKVPFFIEIVERASMVVLNLVWEIINSLTIFRPKLSN